MALAALRARELGGTASAPPITSATSSPATTATVAAQLRSATVHRYSLAHMLDAHRGCVNTLSWDPEGEILLSGSDDCRLVLWTRWYHSLEPQPHVVETGHTRNIFCARFVPQSRQRQVVSCALDGSVRLNAVDHASGTDALLGTSSHFVSKFCFLPGSSTNFITAGHDGRATLYDCRSPRRGSVLVNLSSIGGCTAISFDELGQTFALGCEDPLVRTYDPRMCSHDQPESSKPVAAYGVHSHLRAPSVGHMSYGASDVAFSSAGELVVNQRSADVYRFDTRRSPADEACLPLQIAAALQGAQLNLQPLTQYLGRHNEETFAKEVALVHGEQYVATGGDDGHLHVWDRLSGVPRLLLRGDGHIVNCVAPHPSLPYLAVSGIDSTVKIFTVGEKSPQQPYKSEAPRHVFDEEAHSLLKEADQSLREVTEAKHEMHESEELERVLAKLQSWTCASQRRQAPRMQRLIECRIGLARAKFADGDFQRAMSHCVSVLRVEPSHEEARTTSALSCLELGDMAGAKENVRVALALHPHSAALQELSRKLVAYRLAHTLRALGSRTREWLTAISARNEDVDDALNETLGFEGELGVTHEADSEESRSAAQAERILLREAWSWILSPELESSLRASTILDSAGGSDSDENDSDLTLSPGDADSTTWSDGDDVEPCGSDDSSDRGSRAHLAVFEIDPGEADGSDDEQPDARAARELTPQTAIAPQVRRSRRLRARAVED